MKSLIVGFLLIGLTSFSSFSYAQTKDGVCNTKDSSNDGILLLRAASRFGNVELVRFLVDKRCVDINGKISGKPKLDPTAFLATTPQIFNFYAQNGFNYARSQNGRNFIMASLEREKEGGNIWEDRGILKIFREASKKYKVPKSISIIPTSTIDESMLQERFVSGVPNDLLIKRDENGNNSLHYAISMGKGELAKIIAQRQPQALNRRNNSGLTPLMISAVGCETGSLNRFYKGLGENLWLKRFPMKGFSYIRLSPVQVHMLSKRGNLDGYIKASDLEKERVGLEEIMSKAPSNFGESILDNIANSNICRQSRNN